MAGRGQLFQVDADGGTSHRPRPATVRSVRLPGPNSAPAGVPGPTSGLPATVAACTAEEIACCVFVVGLKASIPHLVQEPAAIGRCTTASLCPTSEKLSVFRSTLDFFAAPGYRVPGVARDGRGVIHRESSCPQSPACCPQRCAQHGVDGARVTPWRRRAWRSARRSSRRPWAAGRRCPSVEPGRPAPGADVLAGSGCTPRHVHQDPAFGVRPRSSSTGERGVLAAQHGVLDDAGVAVDVQTDQVGDEVHQQHADPRVLADVAEAGQHAVAPVLGNRRACGRRAPR